MIRARYLCLCASLQNLPQLREVVNLFPHSTQCIRRGFGLYFRAFGMGPSCLPLPRPAELSPDVTLCRSDFYLPHRLRFPYSLVKRNISV